MTSMMSREMPLKISPSKYAFGRKGLLICCFSGVLCPCMAVYSCVQRRYLNIIYKDNYDNSFTWKEASRACFWPCAIVQHLTFLRHRRDDGLLRFDWEYRILSDLLKPAPKRVDKIFLMVGPTAAGKTELFKKIIGVTYGATRPGRHDTKLRIGVRPMQANEKEILFLELWDVPCEELEVVKEEMKTQRVDGLLLLYDGTSMTSFEEMKDLYSGIRETLTYIPTFCIATKDDIFEAQDRYTRTVAEEWAHQESLQYLSIGSCYDEDVAALMKRISSVATARPVSPRATPSPALDHPSTEDIPATNA
eukprot:CAMPEP_0182429586 /NCGR_PEP_ID=MMETSP1167-20130531/31205_1 /TAXON_ID=2988 /ORGANISM="Mallomonas Sp, Strain CCMP3275" /LENGTH=305 /DNA_ID=CAMNT_0024613467 /DNA_START=397 /DNA_END=1314 /DNA_ORIENTATION=+